MDRKFPKDRKGINFVNVKGLKIDEVDWICRRRGLGSLGVASVLYFIYYLVSVKRKSYLNKRLFYILLWEFYKCEISDVWMDNHARTVELT